ncbi:FtsX-like permease family protein [Vibrio tapetis subsp. quintayensis]|uniref:ABC transporter permease n=1 Tax=Vibrio tapetis TaxID=52443 RepID=UPI0025B47E7D|nr:FtsX-like permease family protein [Vibrio tapetis]MDN3680731.1 FtsX-like permease family protein [Vibrio tapetis subsp. quintayensis]
MKPNSGIKPLFMWSIKEIRLGQLWPIVAALTLIVGSIFALSALADRLEQVIVKQGKDALTADMVFVSANTLSEPLLKRVESNDFTSTEMTRFTTMAFSEDGMQLITVKAVDGLYPLQGEMLLENSKKQVNRVSPGELWLEQRILEQLGVNEGDAVTIGDADFRISGVIKQQPGLAFNPFQQMPTAFIHHTDIEQTGAIQLGSRVQYRLFLQGEKAALDELKENTPLTASDRWMSEDSQSRTSDIFNRTKQYLSLTVAIVILMAATTLVLTSQHYVASRRKTVAMLKSLGASRLWIRKWLFIQVALLFALGSIAGLLLGGALEVLLRLPLTDLLPDPLPSYGVAPYLVALGSCLVVAVPALGLPLINLLQTPAMSVMQSSSTPFEKKWLGLLLVPLIPLLWGYGDNVFVWLVFVGVVVAFVVLSGASLVMLKLVRRFPLTTSMKLAMSRISRDKTSTAVQLGALSLSLMLLAIIWLVRTDLLQDWQKALPADAPNVFALNIAPYESEQYLAAIDEQGLNRSEAYPIVRGRLTEINGKPAEDNVEVSPQEEKTDALRRELNFTWGESLPDYNEVLEGQWTSKQGVSVESEVAQALNIEIGDALTFTINSQVVTATVNTIRLVEWREMKPNFYFIFTPDTLADIPATNLVSFRVDDEIQFLNDLARQYPTVSLLDVRSIGSKIQTLLEQIVWAVTVLAVLGVAAGVMLIFTLLRLSLSQRQQEFRLYRTLGASKARITRTIWFEYGAIAFIAGIVASIGAEASVASIMRWGFELSTTLHPGLWLSLPLLSFLTLTIVLNTLIKRLLIPVNKDA